MEEQLFYIIYETRNIKNNMIYIGQHTTKNLNDSYLGSGLRLKRAIKYYGCANFEKTILFIFTTQQEMIDKEIELVDDNFIARKDTYNLIAGGTCAYAGKILVKDSDGNIFKVDKNDERVKSGELTNIFKGTAVVKDDHGNIFRINKNDPRYANGELHGHIKGKIVVKDDNGNRFMVENNDYRFLTGELVGYSKGLVVVKDENDKKFQVDINDPRYVSGELIHLRKNVKHTNAAKIKMSSSHVGKTSTNGGRSNFCWIKHETLKKQSFINKNDIQAYIDNGWILGRLNINKCKVMRH
jgi:hypothetical protein